MKRSLLAKRGATESTVQKTGREYDMKTLKMGLLGLALGVVSAVVLPSQVAMADSGPAPGNPPKTPPSGCQLRKALCLIEYRNNPQGALICTALYGNC